MHDASSMVWVEKNRQVTAAFTDKISLKNTTPLKREKNIQETLRADENHRGKRYKVCVNNLGKPLNVIIYEEKNSKGGVIWIRK